MREDYGSLRRRTRDSSWQWMVIGLVLGLGLALVACVGLYAFDAISFPVLEDAADSDDQAPVTIAPNETEIAMRVIETQNALQEAQASISQTETASVPEELASPTEAAAELPTSESVVADTPAAPPAADSTQAADLPGETLEDTPAPTSLPGAANDGATGDAAATEAGTSATVDGTTGQQDAAELALTQETPAPTPAIGGATPTIRFPGTGEQEIPAELDAIKSAMGTVTGGTFIMGTTIEEATGAMDDCALFDKVCDNLDWVQDSTPPHEVTVDSFQMELTEVTLTQFVTFLNWMGPNSHRAGCDGQPCALTTVEEPELSYIEFDGEQYSVRIPEFYSNHPATFVTWWGGKEYCESIGRRLPTEAEWERAARGQEGYIYPWGFEYDINLANSSVPAAEGTEPVESYPTGASPYGMLNMAGNVSEWVTDWYLSNYYGQSAAVNPTGPLSGTEKVHRGGSWDTIPLFLRTVHRLSADPVAPTAAIGFRCVEDLQTNDFSASAEASGANNSAPTTGQDVPSGAPTLPPAPTQPAVPTTPPNQPTATLAPG